MILGDFCRAKFIWGTSLIFSTFISSDVTPFLNQHQKHEWNSLEDSQVPNPIEKAISVCHNEQKENNVFNKALIYD